MFGNLELYFCDVMVLPIWKFLQLSIFDRDMKIQDYMSIIFDIIYII